MLVAGLYSLVNLFTIVTDHVTNSTLKKASRLKVEKRTKPTPEYAIFIYVVLNVDHFTCLTLEKSSWLKVERHGFGQGRMGRGKKKKGLGVTEVRFHKRCWLHISPGLYSLVIIFVCRIK
jgi:hypothetical protein